MENYFGIPQVRRPDKLYFFRRLTDKELVVVDLNSARQMIAGSQQKDFTYLGWSDGSIFEQKMREAETEIAAIIKAQDELNEKMRPYVEKNVNPPVSFIQEYEKLKIDYNNIKKRAADAELESLNPEKPVVQMRDGKIFSREIVGATDDAITESVEKMLGNSPIQ